MTKQIPNPVFAACGNAACLPWTMVPSGTVRIIERFGEFAKVARPGLHCLLPCLCECVAGSLSVRLQQLEQSCEAKTKDNVFVALRVAVQYEVSSQSDIDIQAAFYSLTSPHKQIEAFIYDAVRSAVPRLELDALFESKEEVAAAIAKTLSGFMQGLGYHIHKAMVTDIVVDKVVKDAMHLENLATRHKDAASEQGEAVKVRAVKYAEASAAATEIAARAEANARHLAGLGAARQRTAILEGMAENISDFATEVGGVSTQAVVDLITVTQHFDMMSKLGAQDGTALFLDPSPAGLNTITKAVTAGFIPGLPTKVPDVTTMLRGKSKDGSSTSGAAEPRIVELPRASQPPPPPPPAAPAAPAAAPAPARAASGLMSLLGLGGDAPAPAGESPPPHTSHPVPPGAVAPASASPPATTGTGFENARPLSGGTASAGSLMLKEDGPSA